MGDQEIINMITQIGIIPALFAYTMVSIKKSLDANTRAIVALSAKLGVKDNE